MRRPGRRRVAALLAASVLVGACGSPTECGDGPVPEIPLESGTRELVDVTVPSDELPLALGENVRVTVDREAGTVVIVYDEGGSEVRETWRIAWSSYGAE